MPIPLMGVPRAQDSPCEGETGKRVLLVVHAGETVAEPAAGGEAGWASPRSARR